MNKEQSSSATRLAGQGGQKRRVLAFLVLAVFLMAATLPSTVESAKFVVVLDAGHGGSDPGNLGTGRHKKTEKDISLDVTLKVGAYITENYPDVEVVYTRKNDSFPTLSRRVEIANESAADLFISIHCNANDNKGAYGAETFVMGLHKSEESLKTAMRENASIYLEKDHEKNYAGFDPGNPDTYIILSMRENAYLDKSIDVAKRVQDQFRTRVGRKDRGVKQAGYYVISFTNMPSVLVELGFLTNAAEEDYLHSEDGKTYMASAIYRAFKEFKDKEDIRRGRKEAEEKTAQQVRVSEPVVVENTQPVEKVKPAENTATPEVVISTEKPKPADNPVPAETKVVAEAMQKDGIVYEDITAGIRFQVQILSSVKPLNPKSPEFRGLSKVDEYKHKGIYKYLAGNTSSYKMARRMQEKLRAMGFTDAFVIAFENGERIDLSKAIAQTTAQ